MYVPPKFLYIYISYLLKMDYSKKENSSSNQEFSEDRLVFREVYIYIYVFKSCMYDASKKQFQCKHDLRSNVKTVNYQQQAEMTHHTESRSLYYTTSIGTGGFPNKFWSEVGWSSEIAQWKNWCFS